MVNILTSSTNTDSLLWNRKRIGGWGVIGIN